MNVVICFPDSFVLLNAHIIEIMKVQWLQQMVLVIKFVFVNRFSNVLLHSLRQRTSDGLCIIRPIF